MSVWGVLSPCSQRLFSSSTVSGSACFLVTLSLFISQSRVNLTHVLNTCQYLSARLFSRVVGCLQGAVGVLKNLLQCLSCSSRTEHLSKPSSTSLVFSALTLLHTECSRYALKFSSASILCCKIGLHSCVQCAQCDEVLIVSIWAVERNVVKATGLRKSFRFGRFILMSWKFDCLPGHTPVTLKPDVMFFIVIALYRTSESKLQKSSRVTTV